MFLFLFLGWAGLTALGELAVRWQAQRSDPDPRRRLLWDTGEHREGIVLLGDSAFCSYYVGREEETLWARLSAMTGEKVFPGALDGARGPDIRMAAVIVAESWPQGTRVVIELAPTKLLPLSETPAERLAEREGNYKRTLDRRIARREEESPRLAVERWLRHQAARPFRAVSHPEIVESIGRSLFNGARPIQRERNRHAVWTDKRDAVGRKLGQLLAKVQWEGEGPDLDWLSSACRALRAAKLRPLVFIGPFNYELVRQLAEAETAQKLRSLIEAGGVSLQNDLAASDTPMIRMPADLPSECFSDFVHPNTCGEETVARFLADFIQSDRTEVPEER